MSRILTLCLVLSSAFLLHAQSPAPAPPTPAQKAEIYYRQGLVAEKQGDVATAEKAYTAALRENPNHANARFCLGQLKINGPAIAAKTREAKFGAMIIPDFKLEDATLSEALTALQLKMGKLSKEPPNFLLDDPSKKLAPARITLVLKNMPAKAILKYIAQQAGAKIIYDEYAVVVSPLNRDEEKNP